MTTESFIAKDKERKLPLKVRMMHDRVLVKRAKPPEKVGHILVPDSAKESPAEGEVLSIGTKVFDLSVGEKVHFNKSAIDETIDIDGIGTGLLIIREQHIYGALENGTLRPISSKVLIEPDPPEEKSGLIEIPKWVAKDARAREQLVSGRLVAMGLGMRTKKGVRWPMPDVKIGQRVLYFQSYSPEIELGGKMYVIVASDQMRAAIEEDSNGG